LENAELYVKDAEKFLEDGQDEVAILSIGYADGLVDALRLAKGLDPKM
jgi:diphthine synthase